MGKRDSTQRALYDIMAKSKVQQSRDDINALCVAKLSQICFNNDAGIQEVGMEIGSDRDRAYGAMMGLLGLIVQYAERSGGFIALCNYLTDQQGKIGETLPGLSEAKW
jgi:hypothetical protein